MMFRITLSSVLPDGRIVHIPTKVKADSIDKARTIALERWASYKPTIVSVVEVSGCQSMSSKQH